MPLFFVVAIATLLIAIADLFVGAWLATVIALGFWTLSVLALGNGMDWDRRVMIGSAYVSIFIAAFVAVAGFRSHV